MTENKDFKDLSKKYRKPIFRCTNLKSGILNRLQPPSSWIFLLKTRDTEFINNRIKQIFLIFIVISMVATNLLGKTWSPAYPYTQKMDGQNVSVTAIPYSPYSQSPQLGKTTVYRNNKKLYSIDWYHRERIFTSSDGEYLIALFTNNASGIESYTVFPDRSFDFDQKAIVIYKKGVITKIFTLREVIDTTNLAFDGYLFNWGYTVDLESFNDSEFGCSACIEVYGKSVLETGDTTEIDLDDLAECRRQCDSVHLKEVELNLIINSAYVKDELLYILTNQNKVLILDFSNLELKSIPFEDVVPDKSTYNPPKLNRKYRGVDYPEKYETPLLKNGKKFYDEAQEFFDLLIKNGDSLQVGIKYLLINKKGKCIRFFGTVQNINGYYLFPDDTDDNQLAVKLKEWILRQKFSVKTFPKGFEFYAYNYGISLSPERKK